MISRYAAIWIVLWCSFLLAVPRITQAGLSAENVIVVVNADSYNSRTLANEYVQIRDIPSSNVIFLDQIPSKLVITLDIFKQRILTPVLQTIQSRGLSGQARVIAYSADFPTTVDIRSDTAKLTDPTLRQYQKGSASINSMTFFYRFALASDHRYLELHSNLYCRGPFERHFTNPFSDVEQRQQFREATEQFEVGQFSKSADLFEQLFAKAPNSPALAIRAAEAREKAGDRVNAQNMILKAIASGWTSRTWFVENETLAPLLQEPPLSSLAKRLSDAPIDWQEPIGFSSQIDWTPSGSRAGKQGLGIGYLLSCVLGVLHPNGSDIHQATQVLKTAALGDFTEPNASVWFAVSKDVRTKTRLLNVDAAKDWLAHLQVSNESIFGVVPKNQGKCVGLMLGTSSFNLGNRNWEFVPGAIDDNLTSHGGNYSNPNQTKLNALLHAGAAMSSGTVTEPYALQPKFPLPIMYGYYASGVTALEAFYLSVASPYQLLIVGDPLAQPYARPAQDKMTMTTASAAADKKVVQINRIPASDNETRSETGAIEIYLEGVLRKRVPPVTKINIDLPNSIGGEIEFRTVLIGRDSIQSRASHVHWTAPDVATVPTVTAISGASQVRLECDGASSIELLHHSESMGSVQGSSGEIVIDTKKYGGGPLRVRPIAKVGEMTMFGRPTTIPLPVIAVPFPPSKPKQKAKP